MPFLFWLDVGVLICAAIVLAALTLLVLAAGLGKPLNRQFLQFVLTSFFWAVLSLGLRLSLWQGVGIPLLWCEWVTIMMALMAPTLLLFTGEYLSRRSRLMDFSALLCLLFLLATTPPLVTHRLLETPYLHPNGTTITMLKPLGMAIAAIPPVFYLWSLWLFWRTRRETGEYYMALSVVIILAGYILGSVINISFPTTSLTQTTGLLLLGYGVLKHQLFNPLRERSLALQREIQERERTAAALAASEERFRTFYDSVNDAIFVYDVRSSAIVDINQRACKMFGYTRAEACALSISELNSGVPPYTATAMQAWLESAAHGEQPLFEWQAKDRQGRVFWVEVAIQRAQVAHETLLLIVVRDIDARKQAEENHRLLQERMLHTQKLESLGVLAGGIAHDFNNLLCGVLGFTDLAMQDVASGSRPAERLRRIRDAAQRATGLCHQMLAYSGRGQVAAAPVNLAQLVSEMAELIRASLGKKAALELDIAPDLPPIRGDSAQLSQVVLNLILNAAESLDHEDERGRVAIAIGRRAADPAWLQSPYCDLDPSLRDYVFLRVTDNGCGMDEHTLARIFDPFFTTKFAGRGLGLSAVLGIVRGHHGTIQVESRIGQGSVFTVWLPIAEHPTTAPEIPALDNGAWSGSGLVLLIDDEPTVRDTARAMLEMLGFTVAEAQDGQAGIAAFTEQRDSVRLVLLDLTMPGKDSTEILKALRALRADVPVVLTSGYSAEEALARFARTDLAGFLRKPFDLATLRTTLRMALAVAEKTAEAPRPGGDHITA
ncbi:MAG: PAS domain S-box protein [Vicinamibacteria bacterium]|jgi:PAS domain S-box-containing protein|nr:PAS domain S-box protein [Vicinamibacteria bacterium]